MREVYSMDNSTQMDNCRGHSGQWHCCKSNQPDMLYMKIVFPGLDIDRPDTLKQLIYFLLNY